MPLSIFDRLGQLVGLVPHFQYRSSYGQINELERFGDLDTSNAARVAAEQADCVIERYEEFSIGHVEFDDQGQYWDRNQLLAIEDELIAKADSRERPGVLMVCFMHGWKNNAAHNNGNLVSFREMLFGLAQAEHMLTEQLGIKPRRIFGVFLSWRGQSNYFKGVSELTFWNRKKTAHKVGRGDLVSALSRLEQMRFEQQLAKNASRMIIIGHSFGGAAVFSAVAPYIRTVAEGESQAAKLEGEEKVAKIRGFGDLVVLVNPAFEAQLYQGFHLLVEETPGYSNNQHVVMMTVGAVNDTATKLYFPMGQWLGRWLEKRKNAAQFSRIKTAVANFAAYHTHVLKLRGESTEKTKKEIGRDNSMEAYKIESTADGTNSWNECLPDKTSWQIEELPERKLPPQFAFMTVKAEKTIVNGHSGIFLPPFIEFIRDFVAAQDIYSYQASKKAKQENADAELQRTGVQNKKS